MRTKVPTFWYITHLLFILIVHGIIFINLGDIPDLVPNQYSFSGEGAIINSYYPKETALILSFSMGLVFTIIFAIKNLHLGKPNERFEITNEKEFALFCQSSYIKSKGFFCFSFLVIIFVTYIILSSMLSKLSFLGFIISMAVFFIGMFIFIISINKAENMVKSLVKNIQYQNDRWVFGVYYYNKENPKLFVPKRTSLGYTINFANKFSFLFYLFIIGIIALPFIFQ